MDYFEQISADLKAAWLENHRDFEFFNVYKGVPFTCRALLLEPAEGTAQFQVQPPYSILVHIDPETVLLSDGLLDPISARVAERQGEMITIDSFSYAGSKFANRRELRVEPDGIMQVEIETATGSKALAEIADLSLRGAGIRLPADQMPALGGLDAGKTITLSVRLPESVARLPARVRSAIVSKEGKDVRLAVEFTADAPEKALIVHYILRRRAEISDEVLRLYADARKG